MRHSISTLQSGLPRVIGPIVAAILVAAVASPAFAAPTIGEIKLSAPAVACRERIEISLPLAGDFANPFDPRQIEVDGHFTSPGGKPIVMPGFLYQDCRRRLAPDGKEVIEKIGQPCWKVRFSPTEPGTWQVAIKARDRSGSAASKVLRFEATASTSHGYIRLVPGSDYFSYDDGTPFFIIGENIAWSNKRGTYSFDDWIPAAGRAGMNLARIWLQWSSLSIEHKGTGAGRYDLANAWRMDYVLDLARAHKVRVLFTCDSPEPYQKVHYWLGKLVSRPWDDCPHNVANGGPLKAPEEFYTTADGHRLIRQRLRYIVARWGWDPNIFCWELWNELNCFRGWERLVPEIARWHVEMAHVLRTLDPYRHLVTTSFSNSDGHEEIWKLKELDFVQSHCYMATDMAAGLPPVVLRMKQRYGRPHLIGEFGPPLTARNMATVFKLDTEGVQIHNAIWSTALCGGAGAALTWWWDNYVHPQNLYGVFTPLARFCNDVPWTTAGFKPARASVAWIRPPKPRPPRELTLDCQGDPPITGRLVLDPTDPPDRLGRFYLHGSTQRDQQQPIVVEIKRVVDGPLVLRIGKVWMLGILKIRLDGRPIFEERFTPGPGPGPWKKTGFEQQWKEWWADYQQDIALAIPRGKHTLELYNAGKDGITVDRISLPAYVTDERPGVRCCGLVGKCEALLWLQNREHDLPAVLEKREVGMVADVRLTVAAIPAGRCRVEWWDTRCGSVVRTTEEQASADGLSLALPPLRTDVACKVRW